VVWTSNIGLLIIDKAGKQERLAGGIPAHSQPHLVLSSGITRPLPYDPAAPIHYWIQDFSNDGKVLLAAYLRNEQLAYHTEFLLVDTIAGTIDRIRRPVNGVRPRGLTFALLVNMHSGKQRYGATNSFSISRADLPRDGTR
jgi:hypothetical protein